MPYGDGSNGAIATDPVVMNGVRCAPVQRTGTRSAASLSCRTYLSITPARALLAADPVIGEVKVVRARAVESNPTFHDLPLSVARVERDSEVV